MLKCTLDREKICGLNNKIKERNTLSALNDFEQVELSEENISILDRMGIVHSNGEITDGFQNTLQLLSNPKAAVKVVFTGGEGSYEYHINYDKEFTNYVTLTMTPNDIAIDDETNPQSIVPVLKDFIGMSQLKCVNIAKSFDVKEALVIASMIDMERKASLRAFVDEVPFTQNLYNTNMIWRMINSTSSSIQWFVYIINKVVGEHPAVSQTEVREAISRLVEKGVVLHKDNMYQLASDFSLLASRMLVIDNLLSVQTSKLSDNEEMIATGFTCVQSGVHDLLFIDYNGEELLLQTITSAKCIEYIEKFIQCKSYIEKLEV